MSGSCQRWAWFSCCRSLYLLIALFLLFILISFGHGAKLGNYMDDDAYRNDIAELINGFEDSQPQETEKMDPEDDINEGPWLTKMKTSDLRQVYRAIVRNEKRKQMAMDAISTYRRKRPASGILGIDNLDFTASTLDKARSRSRLPMETSGWQMAQQMSKQISTNNASPSNNQGLSMSLSTGDLRRMLDMMKAG